MLKKKSKIQLSKNQKVFRTRPDTRQDSRGQLGRGRNAIITWVISANRLLAMTEKITISIMSEVIYFIQI